MDGEKWQIFVDAGAKGMQAVLVPQKGKVDHLFEEVANKVGTKSSELRLVKGDKQLEYGEGKGLTDYGIGDKDSVQLVLKLRGGF